MQKRKNILDALCEVGVGESIVLCKYILVDGDISLVAPGYDLMK